MTTFIFGIKHSLTAYKTIIDYSEMIAEISSEEDRLLNLSNVDLWNGVISSLEHLSKQSSDYHLNMSMYNYFLKDNNIHEEQFFENEEQYGRKRAGQILSGYPFSSTELSVPSPIINADPGVEDSKVEETKECILPVNSSRYGDM